MTYSAWHSGGEVVLIEGKYSPRFVNGEPFSLEDVRLYVIEADSWETAMAEHHRRQGLEPYRAMPGQGRSDMGDEADQLFSVTAWGTNSDGVPLIQGSHWLIRARSQCEVRRVFTDEKYLMYRIVTLTVLSLEEAVRERDAIHPQDNAHRTGSAT